MKFAKHQDRRTGFVATAEPEDHILFYRAGEIWAPEKWSIQAHQHPNWEVYFQFSGCSLWQIGDAEVEVPEQGAYLIKPGVPHHLIKFTTAKNHFFFCDFKTELLTDDMKDLECWQQAHTIFPQANILLLPFQGLIQELARFGTWSSLNCQAYLTTICGNLCRLHQEGSPHEYSRALHPAVLRAITLMNERLDDDWSLNEVAQLSWTSPSHLARLFQSELSTSPMRYLTQLRMQEAERQLKHTQRTVTSIALSTGFSSSQHLAQVCQRFHQCTPLQLRAGKHEL